MARYTVYNAVTGQSFGAHLARSPEKAVALCARSRGHMTVRTYTYTDKATGERYTLLKGWTRQVAADMGEPHDLGATETDGL